MAEGHSGDIMVVSVLTLAAAGIEEPSLEVKGGGGVRSLDPVGTENVSDVVPKTLVVVLGGSPPKQTRSRSLAGSACFLDPWGF